MNLHHERYSSNLRRCGRAEVQRPMALVAYVAVRRLGQGSQGAITQRQRQRRTQVEPRIVHLRGHRLDPQLGAPQQLAQQMRASVNQESATVFMRAAPKECWLHNPRHLLRQVFEAEGAEGISEPVDRYRFDLPKGSRGNLLTQKTAVAPVRWGLSHR